MFRSGAHGVLQEFSAKARKSGFQTHGCHERKNPHRERFAKEMAKERIASRTKIIGVLAAAQQLCFTSLFADVCSVLVSCPCCLCLFA